MDSTQIRRRQARLQLIDRPQLFVVLIDSNCGFGEPHWEINSPPKPLADALRESDELRRQSPPWITKLEPET